MLAVVLSSKSIALHKKEVDLLLMYSLLIVCSLSLSFTNSSAPPPPLNVIVDRFDSTSIGVSWTKFTLVELKGLASYIVTYDIIIGSRKRQLGGTITVPWTQNRVIISDLQLGADYDITVSTSNLAATSGT